MEMQNRLALLTKAMQTANVDLAAIGPTANMRYLLDYAPHPDERLCLLLLSRSGARIVVPSLNAEELATHTDLELIRWTDAEGPQAALQQALKEISPIKKLAFDGGMRVDFLLLKSRLWRRRRPRQTGPCRPQFKPACPASQRWMWPGLPSPPFAWMGLNRSRLP